MKPTEHSVMIENHNRAYQAVYDDRLQANEDMRFARVTGGQWEGALEKQFENKPRFEINKIARQIDNIESEYRANRISVRFRPKDDVANDDDANVLEGLFRKDEQESGAQEAYDNAFSDGCTGGVAAWKLMTSYEDELDPENEQQKVDFDPIYDACSSVYYDPSAKRYDKSDGNFATIVHAIPQTQFEDEYPDFSPSSVTNLWTDSEYDVFGKESMVFILEYFEKILVKDKIIKFTHPATNETVSYFHSEIKTIIDELIELGFEQDGAPRKVKRVSIRRYVISGSDILEEAEEIAGDYIPVIPMFGKRWYIDSLERTAGVVRYAKDSQRLYNMQVSQMAEIAATSPIERPIFNPEQVQGLEHLWATNNVRNYPYNLINPIKDKSGNIIANGPVGVTPSPNIPPALMALTQLSNNDIAEIAGSTGQDKAVSNVSAESIQLINERVDMSAFMYIDNFAKSLQYSGRVYMSMARDVYGAPRKTRIVNEDGSDQIVSLSEVVVDQQTGESVVLNDITRGNYDVIADVGPAFKSRRQETVQTLKEMAEIIPPNDPRFDVLLSSIIDNMDGVGLDVLKEQNRKNMLLKGLVEPTSEEEQMMLQQAQQPDEQSMAMQQLIASEAQKNAAQAESERADAINKLASAELSKAKTAETLTKASGQQIDNVNKMTESLAQSSETNPLFLQ